MVSGLLAAVDVLEMAAGLERGEARRRRARGDAEGADAREARAVMIGGLARVLRVRAAQEALSGDLADGERAAIRRLVLDAEREPYRDDTTPTVVIRMPHGARRGED